MENRIDLISLKVCKEKSLKYSNKVISNPYSAYEIIKRFIGITDREYFGVLMMNNANEVCSLQICSIGSIDTTIVHPREVFKGQSKQMLQESYYFILTQVIQPSHHHAILK